MVYGRVIGNFAGDTMMGSLMQHHDIDGVIVGADRIVKNGDTANKVSSAPPLRLTQPLTSLDRDLPSCSHGPTARRTVHGSRASHDGRLVARDRSGVSLDEMSHIWLSQRPKFS